jgi:WD40 repeat protein
MKYSCMALLLGAALFINAGPTWADAQTGGDTMAKKKISTGVPTLVYKSTIDLGSSEVVVKIDFSPDGRYLAIGDTVGTAETRVHVWDLDGAKIQASIDGLINPYYYDPVALQWSGDGKFLTFGIGGGSKFPLKLWDPMTGKESGEAPISSALCYPSPDGKSLMAQESRIVPTSVFRVYDLSNWSAKEFNLGGLKITSLAWAQADQALAVGWWINEEGKPAVQDAEGKTFKNGDAVACLVDLAGKNPSKFRFLAPYGVITDWTLLGDLAGTVAALGPGNILDIPSLKMRSYLSSDDGEKIPQGVAKGMNMTMSKDGQYLLLKGSPADRSVPSALEDGSARNLILNVKTGEPLLWFNGGYQGIAMSPDNRQVAVGCGHSVKLFELQQP